MEVSRCRLAPTRRMVGFSRRDITWALGIDWVCPTTEYPRRLAIVAWQSLEAMA